MKITLILIISICLFSFCSAIYPGEIEIITIKVENYYGYRVVNNVSYIGVSISPDNTTAAVQIPTDYPSSSFSIIFYGKKDMSRYDINMEYPISYSSRGGGTGGIVVPIVETSPTAQDNVQNVIENPIEDGSIETEVESEKDYTIYYIIVLSVLVLIVYTIILLKRRKKIVIQTKLEEVEKNEEL